MTVQILRLTGLEPAEAEQAADQLVDLDTGPPDLSNLLVLDDTGLLVQHGPVYGTLDTSRRVENMLCVAVGPRPGNDAVLRLPGNLGGSQGSPVLWVSYPSGIDWRAAAGAVAKGHPPGRGSGLDLLVELLSVDDMFSLVRSALYEKVPGRVANPGLHLAGADDEAATFAAALAVAIGRLCEAGPGAGGPFPALLPSRAEGATLAEGTPLARYRDEVRESVAAASHVLRNRGGLGGMFHQGDDKVRAHLVEAGAALGDLRDLVATLLQQASTVGELTDNQRRQLLDAGIRFPPGPAPSSPAQTAGSAAEPRPVYHAIVKAIRGGDTLALVTRRLTLTERELKRRGSASYLPEVVTRYPPPLLDRLAAPPQRLPRRVTAETWQELGVEGATEAVTALETLVLTVADREWSPAATTPGEVARMRVALDGVCKALTEQAGAAGSAGGGARGARLARLGESLTPVLRDLALRVLAAESAQPSAGGQEAFGSAHERAAARIAEWVQHVQAKGMSSPPPFASSSAPGVVLHADDDDVGEIREALRYRPVEQMWQLCAPKDLGVLNVGVAPEVVRFAPRWSRDALAGTLAEDQPVWTSSGAYAGLLRLVPLKSSFVSSSWSDASMAEPSVAEPS
jgi:hypothetical protein